MVVSEEIRAAGYRFNLSQDGYCYDRAGLGSLLGAAWKRRPGSSALGRLRRAFEASGRMSPGEILKLAEVLGRVPLREDWWNDKPLVEPARRPAIPTTSEPDDPPRKPGFDYVLRRLIGVLFLTPFLLVAPLVALTIHLLMLCFRPDRTVRTSSFRFRQVLVDCARFAFYEDFGRFHTAVLVGSCLAYGAIVAWSLWVPAQAVLVAGG